MHFLRVKTREGIRRPRFSLTVDTAELGDGSGRRVKKKIQDSGGNTLRPPQALSSVERTFLGDGGAPVAQEEETNEKKDLGRKKWGGDVTLAGRIS